MKCICGHDKRFHTNRNPSNYCFSCFELDYKNIGLFLHEFKLDNLSYLEEKYNEQILEEFKK